MKIFWLLAILICPQAGLGASRGEPIEVHVEITEVDDRHAANLGIAWPGMVSFAENQTESLGLGSVSRVSALRADVQFLIEEGAAESLARPNLVTDSGTSAKFHAGGQIPYVTNASLGATHVQFKPYGVIISVQPKALSDGRIRMKVKASVSSPDATNGTRLGGVSVPALREREVVSHVTLHPGATMMLAGLSQTQKETLVSGVPILRKIPFLGALFRWKRTNERRSSIIVFVTPRHVQI